MQGRISGGGGCCIARYTPNHVPTQTYYNPYDLSKIDHIMLRFRPIAPKPGPSGPTTSTPSKNDTVRKGKRKNTTTTTTTTTSSNNGNKRGRKSSSRSPDHHHNNKSDDLSSNGYKVTLPLLPETPDLSPNTKINNNNNNNHVGPVSKWLCFGPSDRNDQTAVDVIESTVIIEGVTDTWLDGNGLGCTDEERRIILDDDTCPGFISDGWNQVWWTNKAFRKMVGGDDDTCVVMVKLEMREKVDLMGVKLFPAMTCRVRVQWGKQSWMTVPCDAWRMNNGGFAWRLDIKAALSLGR